MTWAAIRSRGRDAVVRVGRVVPAPARHVAGMARGTVVAQIAMMLAIPLLARLYGLEAFGVFGIFSTASVALAVAAAGRFEQAIIPAVSEHDAICLVHLSLAIVVAACGVLGFGLVLAGSTFPGLVPTSGMRAALYWLPLGVAAQAVGQVLLQWATRLHQDGTIARFYAVRAIIMTVAQLTFGVIETSQNGLVLGQIAGFSGAALMLWCRAPRFVMAGGIGSVSGQVLQVARTNLDFPRFGLPRTLIEAAAAIAQPILIATLFGAASMGGYWMAQRVLGLPGAVVGEPIRQIFFRRASERQRSGAPLVPLTLRAIAALSMITVPFAVILLIASQYFFVVILGPSWALAAVFVKIMAFGWIAYFVAGLLPAVVILLGLQRQHFLFEIGLRTAEAIAMLIGYVAGSILIALALWSVVNVLYVAGLLWFLRGTERAGARRPAPAGLDSAPEWAPP